MTVQKYTATSLGVVVIGRNEGERLKTSLDFVKVNPQNVIYVDSGSSDSSLEAATQRGISTIELDDSQPLNAARARNTGFEYLTSKLHDLEFIQFIDGDCELDQDWMNKATGFLKQRTDVAAVCGRITERNPEASIYNYLCQREWDTPTGKKKSCGGNSLMRISAFASERGFRDDLIAGEEPELCFRLRAAGWQIWKLPEAMVTHDAGMTRFSEWWKRSVRSGHAFTQGMIIHGASQERFNVRQSRRIFFWGTGTPSVIFFGMLIIGPIGLVLLGIYPFQVLRLIVKNGDVSKANIITALFSGPQGYLWVKSSDFDSRTPCGQAVDFTPPMTHRFF